MKKNIHTILSLLVLSEISFAGGNTAPITLVPVVPVEAIADKSPFYLGLGFSAMSLDNDLTDEEFSTNAVMIQVGYQYNQNFALEGRYTHHIGDIDYVGGKTRNFDNGDYPADFTNIAIYLKPIYPIDSFSFYALLGYGEVELTNITRIKRLSADRAEGGFQWGLGVEYLFSENMSAFIDYVNIYDDEGFDGRAQNADIMADILTLGVTYKF